MKTERTEQPEYPITDHKNVQFPKPNIQISDIRCSSGAPVSVSERLKLGERNKISYFDAVQK